MAKNFKNVQLLFALALCAPICASVQAQDAAPSVPATPAAVTPATPQAASNPHRRLSLVTEQGSFKNVFNSLGEARTAAQGNSYNQTLKRAAKLS